VCVVRDPSTFMSVSRARASVLCLHLQLPPALGLLEAAAAAAAESSSI
jgi:hypothetical protein